MPGTTVQYRSISFLFNPFQVILSRIVRWVEARAPKTVLEQIRRPGHNVDLMLQKKNTWLFMAISERSKVRAAQAHFQKVEHMDGTKKTIWSWPVSPRPHPHCSPHCSRHLHPPICVQVWNFQMLLHAVTFTIRYFTTTVRSGTLRSFFRLPRTNIPFL